MIGGFLGGLANLGGVVQGADKAQDAAIQRALYALSLQQARQQQQSLESVYGGALNLGQGQGGVPGGIPGGAPQQLQMPGTPGGMPGGIPGGIPQQPQTMPQQSSVLDQIQGRESNAGLPIYGGDSPGNGDSSIVKGSVFGNMPGWPDKMAGSTTASGRPVSDPGIALRIPKSSPDFGKMYDVTMPSGKTYQWPQTDYGPAAWTKRGVDISAGAAQQAGYTFENFPTDQPIKIHPAVQQTVNQTGQEAIRAKLPPPAVRESSQTALKASSDLDPRRFGGYDVPTIAQAIEKATPNAPVAVKALALMQLHKLMAPDQQQLVRMEMQQARNELQIGLKEATIEMQRQSLEERRRHDVAIEGRPAAGDTPSYQPFTTPSGGVVAFDTKSGRTKEIPELAGATRVAGGGQAGGTPLTDAAAERYAKIFSETGYLPPGIARNSKAIAQIMNKTGDTGSPGDFVANIATRGADTKSLANMTKLADAATSYENVAIRNFDQALQYADQGISTEMGPWLNRWVATGRVQFGDEKVPPYVTALLTAANEYAKVMTGSTGAAAATEGARKEAAEFFSPYFSKGQIKEVITVAKQEMENRRQELWASVDDVKTRLRSAGSREPTSTGHDPGAPRTGATAPTPSGQKYGSASEVYQAYERGEMTRTQAMQVLKDQFGVGGDAGQP